LYIPTIMLIFVPTRWVVGDFPLIGMEPSFVQ